VGAIKSEVKRKYLSFFLYRNIKNQLAKETAAQPTNTYVSFTFNQTPLSLANPLLRHTPAPSCF
jgi:hypothetical protein